MAVDCDVDLPDVLARYNIRLKRVGKTYRCPCPLHGGDNNQAFSVYLTSDGRWRWRCWTRCGDGDAIEFVMRYERVGFRAACERLGIDAAATPPPPDERPIRPPPDVEPPPASWRAAMVAIVRDAQTELWTARGRATLNYIRARGFPDDAIRRAGLGAIPTPKIVHVGATITRVPPGVAFPVWIDLQLWRITVRRLTSVEPRYVTPGGGVGNAPYFPDSTDTDWRKPLVLVEGPFDALAVWHAAGDLVQVAATGATGCRLVRWLALLARAPALILAFDADPPGDAAAAWWQSAFPNARRWRPTMHDPAEMLEYGGVELVRSWIEEATRAR